MTNIAKRRALAACVILAAALLLRVINLDADPSALISRDFITDEGWWAHNARNAVLYGQWRIDDHNLGLYSAYLYNGLLYLTFKLFGVSFTTLRLLSAVGGWLTVILLFLLVRRENSSRAALFAAALLGLSNLHILYSRTGFPEGTIVFFLSLTLWLWSKRREHFMFCLLSGIAFALMLLTKITAIYLLPGIVLFIMAAFIRRSVRRREALFFLLGSGFVIGAYTVFFLAPNFNNWLQFNLANGSGSEWPIGLSGRVQSILRLFGSSFYAEAPLLTGLSLLWLGLFIVGASRNGFLKAIRGAGELEIIGTTLFIGYMFSLSLTIHQPERRFIPVLFLMTILAAVVLEKGWASLRELASPEYQMGAGGWFAVLFLLPAIGILELKWRALGSPSSPGSWLLKLAIIAGLIALALVISRGRVGHRLRKRLVIASRTIFIVLFCVLSLALIYKSLLLWGLDVEAWILGATGNRPLLLARSAIVLVFVVVIVASLIRARRIAFPLIMGSFLLIEGIQISTWLSQPTYSLKEATASLADMVTRDDTIVTYYETVLLSAGANVICRSVRRGFNVNVFEQTNPDYTLILRRDNWRDYALEEMPPEEWPPPARFVSAGIARFELCPSRLRGPRFIVELYSLKPR
jgi:4-amino-4-deoxy-L-arabinose transferase-like glycosyltransferase